MVVARQRLIPYGKRLFAATVIVAAFLQLTVVVVGLVDGTAWR